MYMYVYMCIYVCICLHVYVYVCMCIYIYAYMCVCIYIVYEISKGSNMFTKTCFKIYLDKDISCQYIFFIFVCYCF